MRKMAKWAWFTPILLAFAAHLSTLDNGFVYDDFDVLGEALPRFTSFNDVWFHLRFYYDQIAYYRPVFYISLMLTRLFSGYEPWGYHLTLVSLHALNSGLVYFLALRFFRDQKTPILGALITATLFAVHPVHIEVVSWVTATIEALHAFFFLLALIFHIQFRNHTQKKIKLVFAVLFFFLALGSKETAVAFLIVAPLYDFLFVEQPRHRLWNVIKFHTLSYGLAFSLYGFLRWSNIPHSPTTYITASPLEGVMRFISAFGFYFQKVLWPASANPYSILLPTTAPFLIISGFFLVLVLVACIHTLKSSRVLFFHIVFYSVCLAPGILVSWGRTSGPPLSERYLYLPVYATCFLFGWLVTHSETILKPSRLATLGKIILTVCIISAGAFFSYTRANIWQDDVSLWTQAIKMNPKSFVPWSNLAGVEALRGNCPQAFIYFDKALSYQDDKVSKRSLAIFHSRKAVCLYLSGQEEESRKAMEKSIKLYPMSTTYFNLGLFHFKEAQKGVKEENLFFAKKAFEEALKIDKSNIKYTYHLGETLEAMNNMDQAKYYYARCAASKQDNEWVNKARKKMQRSLNSVSN